MQTDNQEKSCEMGFCEVLDKLHGMGINCGREISRLAKRIHPDCVAIIPLYRSCLVIMQSEEEKDNGTCTIHTYADPHWDGEDLNIENLKKDEFHFEFIVHGQRSGPELIFKEDGKTVSFPVMQGFEITEKGLNEIFKNLGIEEDSSEKE